MLDELFTLEDPAENILHPNSLYLLRCSQKKPLRKLRLRHLHRLAYALLNSPVSWFVIKLNHNLKPGEVVICLRQETLGVATALAFCT